MRRAFLQRFEHGTQGTFSRLEAPGGFRCYAGELSWRDNAPGISCIPPGPTDAPVIYTVRWTFSPRFRRFMYLVDGVAHRAGIREHSANFMGDADKHLRCQLNGCIAPGERLGWMDGQKAVLMSCLALGRFEAHMEREPFLLEVSNA